ncbi:MAG: prepilin-type N-terminal cleavage/methylation domain-containing protein [Gammaproteobacteria bacterium]|nr:MAG: prepilin-type N-terminal cleavage/methylation domain-containing protein [Gammaproteobacteria bacterium]
MRTMRHHRGSPATRQHGLSLVELMIAMTLSLVLLAGVIQVMSSSKQSYVLEDGMSRMQENARYALDRIARDLSTAGFMGCVESDYVDDKGTAKRFNLVNVLAKQATGSRWDFFDAVSGGDNATRYDSHAVAGTDYLTIRRSLGNGGVRVVRRMAGPTDDIYLDGTDPRAADFKQYDVVAVGNCSGMSVFMITNTPAYDGSTDVRLAHATGVTAPPSHPYNPGQSNASLDLQAVYGGDSGSQARVYTVFSNTYFVAPTLEPGGSGYALFVNDYTRKNELVQDVVNFQVAYGIDSDGKQGVDRYVTATDIEGTSTLSWNQVQAVQFTLTLAVPGTRDVQNRTFSRTVRIRNRGERPS